MLGQWGSAAGSLECWPVTPERKEDGAVVRVPQSSKEADRVASTGISRTLPHTVP